MSTRSDARENRPIWQEVVNVDLNNKVLRLRKKDGKEYTSRWMQWDTVLKPSHIKALIDNGEAVRLKVLLLNRGLIVKSAYIVNEGQSKKRGEKRDIEEKEAPAQVYYMGPRLVSDDEKVGITVVHDTNKRGWMWVGNLWIPYWDDGLQFREQVVSSSGFETKEVALRDAVKRMGALIATNVLGRDLREECPPEDDISLQGRSWLRRLNWVGRQYASLNTVSVPPPGVRLVKSVELSGAHLLKTEKDNVLFIRGDIRSYSGIREVLTGNVVKVKVYADPQLPYVQVGKGVYNTYHLFALLESVEGRWYLSRKGELLPSVAKKAYELTVYETDKSWLLLKVPGGVMGIAQTKNIPSNKIQYPGREKIGDLEV